VQIVVCTITSDADDFALEFAAKAKRRGLRIETDLRNEKINYKVREHSLAKVPVLLAVGRKEASGNTVSVRRLGSSAQTVMGAQEAIEALADEALPPDLREERAAAEAESVVAAASVGRDSGPADILEGYKNNPDYGSF
jgi:threonyl-tRNA synthetase